MKYRSFRNSDPPQIARLWVRQRSRRGLASHVGTTVLEAYVFGKPYFDAAGFIVAEDEYGIIQGFAHAGFGPDESHTQLSTELGVTCMLMVAPEQSDSDLPRELLRRSESYLRERGARVIYGGGIYPLNPFYLGLYGGSELPGILASDRQQLGWYQECGYQEIDRCVVLQRELQGQRLPLDRRIFALKRQYRVQLDISTEIADWWDACASPPIEPTRFEIVPTAGGAACGSVSFWLMEPLSASWDALAVGLTHLQVAEGVRRRGLATYLNSEALRQLQLTGVALVEAQTMISNTAALGLFRKLGFVEIDQGIVLRKQG